MSLFGKKSISYLGVDMGSSSVKIVELGDDKGTPWLKNYGFAEKPKNKAGSEKDTDQEMADMIKAIIKKANFSTKNVVAALHNFDVFTSIISLPNVKQEEMEGIVKTEARKFVPIPLQDVILDWKVLANPADSAGADDKKKKKSKKNKEKQESSENNQDVDVLLTAAPRKLVAKYLNIFEKCDLNLLSLETESFAFIRALLDTNDMFSAMILDIGAVATDIIIVEAQTPVVIRTVDIGGASVTNAVAHNLDVDLKRAEQFKRDVGLTDKDKQEVDSNQQSSLREIIESAFSPIINEINYSIDLYKSRGSSIDKIILSGGSAYLAGLDQFLKKTFNLPVYIGDPWHKIEYPVVLEENIKAMGPMFSVCIGLSLKEILS